MIKVNKDLTRLKKRLSRRRALLYESPAVGANDSIGIVYE